MTENEAYGQAFENGRRQGYEEGKRDAVKHGRWEPLKIPTGIEAFGYKEMAVLAFMCSECGNHIDVSEGHFSHCPNCGAKMDA